MSDERGEDDDNEESWDEDKAEEQRGEEEDEYEEGEDLDQLEASTTKIRSSSIPRTKTKMLKVCELNSEKPTYLRDKGNRSTLGKKGQIR